MKVYWELQLVDQHGSGLPVEWDRSKHHWVLVPSVLGQPLTTLFEDEWKWFLAKEHEEGTVKNFTHYLPGSPTPTSPLHWLQRRHSWKNASKNCHSVSVIVISSTARVLRLVITYQEQHHENIQYFRQLSNFTDLERQRKNEIHKNMCMAGILNKRCVASKAIIPWLASSSAACGTSPSPSPLQTSPAKLVCSVKN